MRSQLHEWLENFANPQSFERMVRLLLQRHIPGYQSNDDSRGDDGADGFSLPERCIYQIWCPEHTDQFQKRARAKIADDIAKIPRFRERVPANFASWVFVTTRELENSNLAWLRAKLQAQGLFGMAIGRNQLISWLLHSPDIAEQFVPWPITHNTRRVLEERIAPLFAWLSTNLTIKRTPVLACSAMPMRQIEVPFAELEDLARKTYTTGSSVGVFTNSELPDRKHGAIEYRSPADRRGPGEFRYWRLSEEGHFFCALTGIGSSAQTPDGMQPVVVAEGLLRHLFDFAHYVNSLGLSLAEMGQHLPGFDITIQISNIKSHRFFSFRPKFIPKMSRRPVDVDPLTITDQWTEPIGQVISNVERICWHFHTPMLPEKSLAEVLAQR